MAALATLERFWPSLDISYDNRCVIVWDMAWHSHHVAANILVVWDILHVNHDVLTPWLV